MCNFSFGPRAGAAKESRTRRRRNEREVEKCVKVRVPGKYAGNGDGDGDVDGGGVGLRGCTLLGCHRGRFWGGVIARLALPACCLTSGEVSLKNNFAYKLLPPASIPP